MKGLSDSTYAIEASLSSGIKKGDYLTDPDNNTYLINWFPDKTINCLVSQIQLCNAELDFERFQNLVYDYEGNVSTPCSYITIAGDVKGYFYRYGMGLYDSTTTQIGVPPSQKIVIGIQYNSVTSLIQIADEFTLNNINYVIIDVDYSQINTAGDYGIFIIHAQVLEGGRRA
jgi:hypothetical protein